jgi:hypothetical protein
MGAMCFLREQLPSKFHCSRVLLPQNFYRTEYIDEREMCGKKMVLIVRLNSFER